MNLLIGCSSREDIPDKYFKSCAEYLEELFKENNNLVFGAYNAGIMRVSYEMAVKYNRDVIGINPKIFESAFLDLNCNKEIVTNTINERTSKLIEEADALIFMPGGVGTIYEFFTALESKRSGEFNKPIVIYNACNYFDRLLLFMEDMYDEKFTSNEVRECYHISNSAKDTLEYIKGYKYNN